MITPAASLPPSQPPSGPTGTPTPVDAVAARLDGMAARVAHLRSFTLSDGGLTEGARRALVSAEDVPALIGAVRAVLELHAPLRIYDDCGHRHTAEDVEAGRAKNISEVGYVCEDGFEYEICHECCTDGEYQTEDCALHERPCVPCPTVAALTQHLAPGQEGE